MRPRDDNKVEAIIAATVQLVNEVGFAEASTSKIAKRAGVSAATIYIYFENKEDMLRKIYLKAKQRMSGSILSGLDPTASVRDRFELFMRNFVDFILSHKEEYLFMEQLSNSPMLRNWCLEETSTMFMPVFSLYEEGRRLGLFKEADTQFLGLYSIVPIAQLTKEQLKGNVQLDGEMLRTAIQMSWDAIAR